jgi:hypothetical protein
VNIVNELPSARVRRSLNFSGTVRLANGRGEEQPTRRLMHSKLLSGLTSGMVAILLTTAPAARAQSQPAAAPAPAPQAADDNDPVRMLVGRLDLEKYKATIKGLTQFGDRRQGTDRNRAAIDWIEAQLKSYGCTNTERVKYDYQPPAGRGTGSGAGAAAGAAAGCDCARAAGPEVRRIATTPDVIPESSFECISLLAFRVLERGPTAVHSRFSCPS